MRGLEVADTQQREHESGAGARRQLRAGRFHRLPVGDCGVGVADVGKEQIAELGLDLDGGGRGRLLAGRQRPDGTGRETVNMKRFISRDVFPWGSAPTRLRVCYFW